MVLTGIFFHLIGASSAALCYTPQKKLRGWSWQTYWFAQALFCWLLLPVLVAWLTIPELMQVLQEAPAASMRNSFLLGVAYGIGGTAFGIAIRYVGFSLTYAISVGISCVLGTILPPLVAGTLPQVLDSPSAPFLIAGMAMGAIGIACCGIAGRSKEMDMERSNSNQAFSLRKGLPLCLLAGVLSALYGYSLAEADPIAAVAAAHGAGHYQENVKYIFSNSGAFVSTAIYCIFLHVRYKTAAEYRVASSHNFFLAFVTGLLWYGQFFFYGLGHLRMGKFKFTSWAIHMILLVLLSALAGLIMKEWKGTGSAARRWLTVAIISLILAVVLLTRGNYSVE